MVTHKNSVIGEIPVTSLHCQQMNRHPIRKIIDNQECSSEKCI